MTVKLQVFPLRFFTHNIMRNPETCHTTPVKGMGFCQTIPSLLPIKVMSASTTRASIAGVIVRDYQCAGTLHRKQISRATRFSMSLTSPMAEEGKQEEWLLLQLSDASSELWPFSYYS